MKRTKADADTNALVKEAYEQLQEALKNISSNEGWLEYLSFQSKFYNYSFNNVLLIYSQNSKASYVAGYNKWQSMNRYVKKGQRGIRIFAPLKYKTNEDDNENGDDVLRLAGFRLVSVFDVTQTDGSDEFLPILVSGLKNTVEGESEIYNMLLSIIDVPVKENALLPAKGCYYPSTQKIEIKSTLSTVQKIKTLAHEYSHHLHHTKYYSDENYDLGEVVAESSAYIVCNFLGINTINYSAGYINGWAKDQDALQKTATKVQRISHDIIELINMSSASPLGIIPDLVPGGCSDLLDLDNGRRALS